MADQEQTFNSEAQVRMRNASGNVTGTEPIIAFIYVLLRDHVAPGKVEDIILSLPAAGVKTPYSNGWLARYAADIAQRLLAPPVVTEQAPSPQAPEPPQVPVPAPASGQGTA